MPRLKEREPYFDNLKFILIVLVVMGHFLEPLIETSSISHVVYLVIYTFHMPAFVLLSGFFSRSGKSPFGLIMKFMVPFMVFQALFLVFAHFFLPGEYDLSWERIITPSYIYWYLPALFAWNLALPLFVKLGMKNALILSVLMGVGAGYIEFIDGRFSLSRILVFLPFFLLGYFMKKEHFIWMKKAFRKRYAFAIMLSTFLIAVFFGNLVDHRWLWGYLPYERLESFAWYSGIFRIALYVLSAAMCLAFIALVPTRQKPFSILGTRTLTVYLLHGFIVKNFFVVFSVHYFENLLGFFVLVSTAIATSLLLAEKKVSDISNLFIQPYNRRKKVKAATPAR